MIPPLKGPFSKRLRAHLTLIVDAVNALTEGATMPLVISPEEPADAAGFWLRLVDNVNSYQLYARENATDSWTPCSAGVGANGDPFGDLAPRQVGVFVGDPADEDFAGLQTDSGSVRLSFSVNGGRKTAAVFVDQTRAVLQWSGLLNCSVQVDDEGVKIPNLPDADPHVAGALWDDGGTLKRSQG
jgi:hypothetical protein